MSGQGVRELDATEIGRLIRQAMEAVGPTDYTPSILRCSREVRAVFAAMAEPEPKPAWELVRVPGLNLDLIVDPSMASGEWRLVSVAGTVLNQGHLWPPEYRVTWSHLLPDGVGAVIATCYGLPPTVIVRADPEED